MASPFSEEEIQEKVDQYKREGDWDAEKKEPEKNTERAIRTLAESIVENYDNRAGTDEFSTLLRICQVRTKEETKKRRVDGLSIPDEDKEQIHAYIEEGRGIVGTGMAQISIPDDHEEDAYKLLETLVTSDSQEELDSAIETFASLEIKGVQSGVLSPIIYFLHPSKYPIINGPVEERFEDLLDYEVSRRISDYTSEAEKIREFRDEYGLGGDEGNLRDLDWFLYTLSEDDGPDPSDNPTIWIEKTAIHGPYKGPGGSEIALGRAVFSPQRDAGDRDIYWSLREAEVGDIVVHILKDRRVILGASVIASELVTDYDFPEPVLDRWEEEQREEGGYLRWLDDFQEFDDPPDLEDDFLQKPEYREELDRISQEYSGLFYTRLRKLVQGGYLSECPEPLADLLAQASPEIEEYFREHGYESDEPPIGQFCGSLSSDPQIFQIPLTPGAMRDNFEKTVESDVPRDAINDIVDTDLERDSIRLWGGGPNSEKVDPGDLLLFGDRRSNEYIYAATVKGSEVLPEDRARDFCKAVEWEFEDPYRYINYLEEVYEIDLEAPDFWDLMDYDDFPNDGFSRLWPDRVDSHIVQNDEYGSVDAFLKSIAVSKVHPARSGSLTNIDDLIRILSEPDYTVTMPDELFFEDTDELQNQIEASLNSGKHLIFTGPPGTGKSKLAKEVAKQAETHPAIDDHVFTTATAEWTTFDTIGGYVPSATGNQLVFDPRLFLECFRSDDGDIKNKWLVIDELNRANIDKALGPLFSVLARDSVELPYEILDERVRIEWVDSDAKESELKQIARQNSRYPVTPSWRLIGTMNTVDKTSLYDLSFAFMRRFSFVHIGTPKLIEGGEESDEYVTRAHLDPGIGNDNYVLTWLETREDLSDTINQFHEQVSVIWAIINQHRPIGPAIVLDIFNHLQAHQHSDDGKPLTSAIISLVLPQLEGLREQEYHDLLDNLDEGLPIESEREGVEVEEVDLQIDSDYLRRKAYDMFDLDSK